MTVGSSLSRVQFTTPVSWSPHNLVLSSRCGASRHGLSEAEPRPTPHLPKDSTRKALEAGAVGGSGLRELQLRLVGLWLEAELLQAWGSGPPSSVRQDTGSFHVG